MFLEDLIIQLPKGQLCGSAIKAHVVPVLYPESRTHLKWKERVAWTRLSPDLRAHTTLPPIHTSCIHAIVVNKIPKFPRTGLFLFSPLSLFLKMFIYLFYLFTNFVGRRQHTHTQVRGQLWGVGSLLPPTEFQRSNLGH